MKKLMLALFAVLLLNGATSVGVQPLTQSTTAKNDSIVVAIVEDEVVFIVEDEVIL